MVSEVSSAKPTERPSKPFEDRPPRTANRRMPPASTTIPPHANGPSDSPSQSVASTAVISGALPRAIG